MEKLWATLLLFLVMVILAAALIFGYFWIQRLDDRPMEDELSHFLPQALKVAFIMGVIFALCALTVAIKIEGSWI